MLEWVLGALASSFLMEKPNSGVGRSVPLSGFDYLDNLCDYLDNFE
jgi:hypothetical protein